MMIDDDDERDGGEGEGDEWNLTQQSYQHQHAASPSTPLPTSTSTSSLPSTSCMYVWCAGWCATMWNVGFVICDMWYMIHDIWDVICMTYVMYAAAATATLWCFYILFLLVEYHNVYLFYCSCSCFITCMFMSCKTSIRTILVSYTRTKKIMHTMHRHICILCLLTLDMWQSTTTCREMHTHNHQHISSKRV